MEQEKSGLFLVSIVAIVAIVGLIVLFNGNSSVPVTFSEGMQISDEADANIGGEASRRASSRSATKSVSSTCTENDGGKNIYVKGNIMLNGNLYATDSCNFNDNPPNTKVQEFWCSSPTANYASVDWINCAYGCENGACKNQTIINEMTFNVSVFDFTEGSYSVLNSEFNDPSVRPIINYYGPRFCQSYGGNYRYFLQYGVINWLPGTQFDIMMIWCTQNVPSEILCGDSDGGVNYAIKGNIFKWNLSFPSPFNASDFCALGGNMLNRPLTEFFCSDNEIDQTTTYCACFDGACITYLNQTLYVDSMQYNTNVYVDNVFRGTTPVVVSGLSVGTHQLKGTKPGFQDYVNYMPINPSSSTNVVIDLQSLNSKPRR